jgi:hypothetical protein
MIRRLSRVSMLLLLAAPFSAASAQSKASDGAERDAGGGAVLIAQNAIVGLGFYGWAVPFTLDVEGPKAGALYLLTSSASFFVPFMATRADAVSPGMARMNGYGITRGVAHGILLYNLLLQSEAPKVCDYGVCIPDPDDEDRARAGMAMVASVAEGVGGYIWARQEGMSRGTVSTIGLGGDAGLLWGLGAAYVAGTEDIAERSTAALALPASAAGLIAGRALAGVRSYSTTDVGMLYTVGVLGGYTGLATVAMVDPDADRSMVAAAILGSALGGVVADRLVKDAEFSSGQTTLMRLGTLAGGLAGASIGVLAESDRLAIAGGALGAAAGFALTYRAFEPEARAGQADASTSLDVTFTPASLLAAALPRSSKGASPSLPLLGVEYRLGRR